MSLTYFRSIKYQRWYEALIAKAKARDLPKLNTEDHHIWPRALGGSDDPSNLVRLTYREHFIAHWLLTKTCTGSDLRKMQFALFAMTMCANGTRIVAGWQYDVARRALYEPIQLANAAEARRKQRLLDREIAEFKEQYEAAQSGKLVANLAILAKQFTRHHKLIGHHASPQSYVSDDASPGEPRRRRVRRRRLRPGKRGRAELRAAKENLNNVIIA